MEVGDLNEVQQLWEWREKIANLYYEVRSSSDAVAAWELWRNTRSAGVDRRYAGSNLERCVASQCHRPGSALKSHLTGTNQVESKESRSRHQSFLEGPG